MFCNQTEKLSAAACLMGLYLTMIDFIKNSLISACVCLILACSPDSKMSSETVDVPGNVEVQKALSKAQLSCMNSEDCAQNVGLIFSLQSSNIFQTSFMQCNGFLVSDDIVATNSHCISDNLKKNPKLCSTQLAIKFVGAQSKTFICKELLEFSTLSMRTKSADYAFFRIEKTGIPPLTVIKSGVKGMASVRTITVSHEGSEYKLKSQGCELVYGSLLGGYSLSAFSPILSSQGCKTVHGNSGSPVLIENGMDVGIVQAIMETYSLEVQRFIEDSDGGSYSRTPPHNMMFTNFACTKDSITGTGDTVRCERDKSLKLEDCVDFKSGSEASVLSALSEWNRHLPQIMVYQLSEDTKNRLANPANSSKSNELVFELYPICVRTKYQTTEFDKYVKESNSLFSKKLSIVTNLKLGLRLVGKIKIDEKLRIRGYRFTSDSSAFAMDSIQLTKSDKNWVGTLARRGKYSRIELPECTIDQIEAVNKEMAESDAAIESSTIKEAKQPVCER